MHLHILLRFRPEAFCGELFFMFVDFGLPMYIYSAEAASDSPPVRPSHSDCLLFRTLCLELFPAQICQYLHAKEHRNHNGDPHNYLRFKFTVAKILVGCANARHNEARGSHAFLTFHFADWPNLTMFASSNTSGVPGE